MAADYNSMPDVHLIKLRDIRKKFLQNNYWKQHNTASGFHSSEERYVILLLKWLLIFFLAICEV